MVFNNLSAYHKFIVSRWAYSVGEPVISDSEYQILLETMQATMPDDPYVNRSWSDDPCPVELLRQIGREDLIHKVTLTDKTNSIPSLGSFAMIQRELHLVNSPGTLSMKHDGWNIQANYYEKKLVNVHTRGRASDVVDVSKLSKFIPQTIPADGKVKVVMELTCPKSNFGFCARTYGNVSERSAVSTLLAHPEHLSLLTMHAIDVHGLTISPQHKFKLLQEWGFQVPMWYEVETYEDIMDALESLSAAVPIYEFPSDGAVYDGEIRRALRVLAWEEPIYKSYVVGYLEQYGANRISPSICIEPVLRNGINQRRVNITNWQRIINFNLQPGAPVAFRIASDANAAFDEESTRLLHKTYEGKWREFQELVQENERLSRERWSQYISG